MLGILTSRIRAYGNSPPTGGFVLNEDSWQAQGLRFWLPGIDGARLDRSRDQRNPPTETGTVGHTIAPALNARAFDFTPTTYFDYGTFPFLSEFTISFWTSPTINGSVYRTLVSRGGVFENDSNFAIGMRHIGGNVRPYMYAKNGGTLVGTENTSDITPGVWMHIVASWQASDQRLYHNGVQITSSTTSNGTDGSQNLKIGNANSGGSDNPYDGDVLDVRIYDRAFTAEQVWQLYEPSTRWDLFYRVGVRRILMDDTTVVSPPVGTWTSTGLVPEIRTGARIDVPLGTQAYTGQVPGISIALTIFPPVGALVSTGQLPAISTGAAVTAPVGTHTATGLVPTISTGVAISAPVGTHTGQGLVPSVATGVSVVAPVGALGHTGLVPVISTGVGIQAPVGALNSTGLVPTISTGAKVELPLGTQAYTGAAPSVATGASATVPLGAWVTTGHVPSVPTGASVQPLTGQQAYSGHAPVVSTGVEITVPVGGHVATGLVPQVSTGAALFAPIGSQAYTGAIPVLTSGAAAFAPLGVQAYTGQVPSVRTGVKINVPLGTNILAGILPRRAGAHHAYAKVGELAPRPLVTGTFDLR